MKKGGGLVGAPPLSARRPAGRSIVGYFFFFFLRTYFS